MTEKRLIEAIKSGDRVAFRDFVEENIGSLNRLVIRIVTDEDDAKDIVQDTFIRVWEKRTSIKSENHITPWVKRIAINKCYDHLRWQKRNRRQRSIEGYMDAEKFESDITSDNDLNREEFKSIINSLTGRLSRKQKLVFTLSELEGLSHDEILEITGLSKTSIKSNLQHARRKIGNGLEKM